MLQESAGLSGVKCRWRPRAQAKLTQHHLRWVTTKLFGRALDAHRLCIENNLRGCSDAISKSFPCNRICSMFRGIINTMERVHSHMSLFDTPSVAGIRWGRLMALQYRLEGSRRRTVRLSAPS
eukprot:9291445-Pyramimonas_sp.AAC.1